MHSLRRKIERKIRRSKFIDKLLGNNMDKFLKDISGVIHVGANIGQECKLYNQYGLNVVWIEPIPRLFEELKGNISGYSNQLGFQELITDMEDKEYEFHVANNNGASSSIYDFNDHKDMWPDIHFEESIFIKSRTLTSLFKEQGLDAAKYQALVMDTQGSELLVLKGSLPLLKFFKYIKTEVPDFESYKECCTLGEMEKFMNEHGYKEHARKGYAKNANGGRYYDIIYRQVSDD